MGFAVSQKVSLIDGVTPVFMAMGSAAQKFASMQSSAFSRANADMRSMISTAKGYIVGNAISSGMASIGQGIRGMASEWVQFDQSSRFAASRWDEVQTGAMNYNDALAQTKKISMEVGAATKFTGAQVADAMNTMAADGYSLQQSNKSTMLNIAKFSTIAETDIATGTRALTGSMAAWRTPFAQIEDHAALMVVAANASRMSVIDMAEATKQSAPIYSTMGLNIKSYYAMLMALSKVGIVGAEAGTRQRGIISALFRPQTMKELKGMNINIADQFGNVREPLAIIDDIRKRLGGLGTAAQGVQLKKLFEQYEMGSVMQLMQMSGKDFEEIMGSMGGSRQKFNDQFMRANDTFLSNWKLFTSAVSIKVFSIFETSQSGFMQLLKDMTSAVSNFDMSKIVSWLSVNVPLAILKTQQAFTAWSPVLTDIVKMLATFGEIVLYLSPVLVPMVDLFVRWKVAMMAVSIAQGLIALTQAAWIGNAVIAMGLVLLEIQQKGILAGANYALALAQEAVNATNPIGWIIIAVQAIAALGVGLWVVADHWDAWGGKISESWNKYRVFFAVLMPGLYLIVNTTIKLLNHWDSVSRAFADGGIVSAITQIGKIIISSLLDPLEMVVDKLHEFGLISELAYGKFKTFKAGLTAVPTAPTLPAYSYQSAGVPGYESLGNTITQKQGMIGNDQGIAFTPDYGINLATMPVPAGVKNYVGVEITVKDKNDTVSVKKTVNGKTGSTDGLGLN